MSSNLMCFLVICNYRYTLSHIWNWPLRAAIRDWQIYHYPFCFAFSTYICGEFFLNACMHFWSSIYLVVLFCLSRIELFYDGDLLIFLLSYSHKRFWVDFSIPSLYWLWFLEFFFFFKTWLHIFYELLCTFFMCFQLFKPSYFVNVLQMPFYV